MRSDGRHNASGAVRRGLAAAMLVLLTATQASALAQIQATGMSCAQVQASLQKNGQAVVHYRSARNPTLPLYDRYVANAGYCSVKQLPSTFSVPTRDNPKCRLMKCISKSND